jgi:hypothetical protein
MSQLLNSFGQQIMSQLIDSFGQRQREPEGRDGMLTPG